MEQEGSICGGRGVWEVMVPVDHEELTLAYQLGDTDAGKNCLHHVEGLIRHQASKMCGTKV